MNSPQKKVAVILLNYKSKKETIECINSLKNISGTLFDYNIIIVDNSPADSGNYISDRIKKIKNLQIELIKSQENTGFSKGNNIGIRHAIAKGNDYVLVLNNDTLTDKNFLNKMFKTAESDNKIGIVVPKIYFAKGHEFHKNRYDKKELGKVIWYAGGKIDWKNVIGFHLGVDEVDKGQFDKVLQTEYATGACMLIKKEVVEKVGIFDEKYFLYYEDSDLSMRVKKKGYKIIYDPKAIVWHKNAASSGGSGSSLQDYYTTRNRLLFSMRYAPIRAKIALLKESFLLLFSGRKWQKKGVKDFYFQNFGKGSFK